MSKKFFENEELLGLFSSLLSPNDLGRIVVAEMCFRG